MTEAVRDEAGSDGVGAFYGAIGERVHKRGDPLYDPATVEAALRAAGLDAALTEANVRERVQRAHVVLTRGYAVGLS